ncbi:hypothetical protein DBR11_18915 [Pedobacter sp. HMWF019]|nr:hypothetical protein DBR11_18915 [Pedobacter sp. HMWF019]
MSKEIPIQTLHLFPVLDTLLIELLNSLQEKEWQLPTIASLWTVKDIAAHLLDGNMRALSGSRDQHFNAPSKPFHSYTDLIVYLNQQNAEWIQAAKRLSSKLVTNLLQITGEQYYAYLRTLNPFDKAISPVAWAGESQSENWFHIAREYTEKFIHQQQIRDAVNNPGLFTKELFYPFIKTLMYALPYTYRNTHAPEGSIVEVRITGEAGGQWRIINTDSGWQQTGETSQIPDSTLVIDPQTAWKLFSKGISPAQASKHVKIFENQELGSVALQMISVMA